MKLLYTTVLILFTFISSAQHSLNTGFSWSVPGDQMANNIGSVQNISAGYMYKLPRSLDRLSIGAEVSWGIYADTEKMQTFNFSGGGSMQTWVYYSSQVLQTAVTARVDLLKGDYFVPYINGKLGHALFYSSIFVEDPHDEDGCKPLQQDNLISDGTLMAGYGGGIRLNMGLFKRNKEPRNSWIDISVNKVSGGKVNYINTKRLIDASAPPPLGSDGKALNIKFINATTQEIHEHQVAEVYTTPLRLMDIKISYFFKLAPLMKKKCRRSK